MFENKKKIIAIGIIVFVMLVSIFGGTRWAAPTKGYSKTIESLDEKKMTVMKLTAAATAASVAVGAVPGDSTTPIAEKLADISSYFLVVLCAIFFEKYLLSITGFTSFCLLIPAACVLAIIYILIEKRILMKIACKIGLLGILIAFAIPISVSVGDGIEKTYSASIQNTIDAAEKASDDIDSSSANEDENKGLWEGITSKVTDGVSSAFAKFENVLSNFMEAVAVMLVTSCVIPIAVILFFAWIIKVLLGINIEIPPLSKKFTRKKSNRK